MPPRPQSARPVANRIFTNRERPIASFNAARTDLPADRHRVLTYYGIGGQGKTALCGHLMAVLAAEAPPRHLWGHVTFDDANVSFREPARALLEMRRTLRQSGAIKTPIFDVALLYYWSHAYPTEDLNKLFNDFLGDHADLLGSLAESAPSWLGTVVQEAEALPAGLGLLVKGLNQVRQWFKTRGAKAACDALNGLEQLDNTRLAAQLPWFLGLDLEAHRARPDALPPVIFIDTYEALWSGRPSKTGAAALEADAWVRELVASARGVLFVILGRERLTWDCYKPEEWADVLTDQHLLGGLADADAERFLAAIPVPDPAVRQAIIAGAKGEPVPQTTGQARRQPVDTLTSAPVGEDQTRGAVPYYLDRAVVTYQDILAAGRTPAPEDFGKTHPEVLARFLRYRTLEECETLKVLAVPRGFDQALFEALVERFGTRYPRTALRALMTVAGAEPGPDGRYSLHDLLRDHLRGDLDPAIRAQIDAFLFDWFDARAQPASPREVQPAHEAALREAVYHRDTGDAAAALYWFWGRQRVFDEAARYALLEPLHRWAMDRGATRLGPDHPATAGAMNNLALLLQTTNRLPEAEELMRRVVDIFGTADPLCATPAKGFGLMSQRARLLRKNEALKRQALATALNNLAQILDATNRLPEAEELMRRDLEISEASYGKDHPKVAISINNLGCLLKKADRSPEAEPLIRRALAIHEANSGPNHSTVAVDLNNLGTLLHHINRSPEAEPLLRRALAIDEANYGPGHPAVAGVLCNLAGLLAETDRLPEAEPLMVRALEIDEANFGPGHPRVATHLNNLAQLLQATNRLAEAEPLMRRGLEILETSLGATHPDFAVALGNLAALLWSTNRLAEAEPLMRRGLLIRLALTRTIGGAYPNLRHDLADYWRLLVALFPQRAEAARRLADLFSESGLPPEDCQRLLEV